jgi:sigma-B regulation protein RsbU (phosphoserine phosphatase)
MSLTYSLMRAEAVRSASPGEALRTVNRHLLDINASGMFVTLLYGEFNCVTRRFEYARAGHPHPILLDGAGQIIEGGAGIGQPLGLFEYPLLDEQSLTFPEGGTALMFSDGLSEAMNDQNEEFGLERVQAILSANRELSAQAICDCFWKEMNAYAGPLSQQDDFTVVVMKGNAA